MGQAILAALQASAPVASEDFSKVSAVKNQDGYHNFFNGVMKKFSYKTKRDLFKKMKLVPIYLENNCIELHPMKHDKLQAWEGLGDDSKNVIIPLSAPPAEIGQALYLAFERCK